MPASRMPLVERCAADDRVQVSCGGAVTTNQFTSKTLLAVQLLSAERRSLAYPLNILR